MPAIARSRNRKYGAFQKLLVSHREKLRSRLDQHLEDVYIDREPDDEAAEATRNLTKDLALAALERERRTLAEIELALQRIASGDYSFCERCGTRIPDVRLQALPWTRSCVECAEHNSPGDGSSGR